MDPNRFWPRDSPLFTGLSSLLAAAASASVTAPVFSSPSLPGGGFSPPPSIGLAPCATISVRHSFPLSSLKTLFGSGDVRAFFAAGDAGSSMVSAALFLDQQSPNFEASQGQDTYRLLEFDLQFVGMTSSVALSLFPTTA